MTAKRKPTPLFVVLGLVFIALGASGQRTFLYVGIAFLVIGVATLVRRRRGGGV